MSKWQILGSQHLHPRIPERSYMRSVALHAMLPPKCFGMKGILQNATFLVWVRFSSI